MTPEKRPGVNMRTLTVLTMLILAGLILCLRHLTRSVPGRNVDGGRDRGGHPLGTQLAGHVDPEPFRVAGKMPACPSVLRFGAAPRTSGAH
jgi:hypothetical protein